jgi:COP9 signalosome complex subunit 7
MEEDKLEGFVVLARSSEGDGVVMVIQQALKDKSIFQFGELLSLASVARLQGTPNQPWLDLLQLFAYGSWKDYQAQRQVQSLPDLSPGLLKKLQQLSLVSLAAAQHVLPYALLQEQLGIRTLRELEDLVIDTVYQGLVTGKLDQGSETVIVETTVGRDINPNDVSDMIAKLSAWIASSGNVLGALKEKAARADMAKTEAEASHQAAEEQAATIQLVLREQQKAGAQQMTTASTRLMGGLSGMMGMMGGGGTAKRSGRRR